MIENTWESIVATTIHQGYLSAYDKSIQCTSRSLRHISLHSRGFEGVIVQALRKGMIREGFALRQVSKQIHDESGLLRDGSGWGMTTLMGAIGLASSDWLLRDRFNVRKTKVDDARVLSLLDLRSYQLSARLQDRTGNSALHDAVHSPVMTKRLLECGADPNATNNISGATPLHHAILEGEACVSLLLERYVATSFKQF